MAQGGHAGQRLPRQLSGVKRTFRFDRAAAADDPKRPGLLRQTNTGQSDVFSDLLQICDRKRQAVRI